MHRIEVDDDVYAELERNVRGFEQPNDVLKRLLLPAGGREVTQQKAPTPTGPSIPGALASLIEQGKIKPGDTLAHVQIRKGRRFTATVEADGWIRTERDLYKTPSPALGDLVGSSIDGWANWTHERSGKTLRGLRGSS